ncbi:hypothetical protein HAX54_008887, partial [Datura stramonium]|nr:hypothetical protein [Datura stramonium]
RYGEKQNSGSASQGKVLKKIRIRSSEPARCLRGMELELRDSLYATLSSFAGVPDSSEPARWLHGTEPELRDGLRATLLL